MWPKQLTNHRGEMVGVPSVAQHNPAVGAVTVVFKAHLLALSFLQAHRDPLPL